ncbi:hypothetical protein [Streptomyces sp. TRM64462]|uniref:hypothetical protein n=1 Tax=Streptomyces sp. TRM64462 TaxID=2741726 RepID=UPI001585E303|nr:hypothetical protein [Streptomyces sp. TRM64462]
MALPSPVRRGRPTGRVADMAVAGGVSLFVVGWTLAATVSAGFDDEPRPRC